MTLAQFKKNMNFYLRFIHSFTRIGYLIRSLIWGKDKYDLTGQIWLVTGATGGIGGATVIKALEHGATVIAAARNIKKVEDLRTAEGFETTYGVNLLNHHQLTESLIKHAKFNDGARLIEVASGGMYNAPLNTVMLDQKAKNFNGAAAYTSHKRAQMVLIDFYRKKHAGKGLKFYAMHPGWVDTDTVKTGLPVFRALLWPLLRTGLQGADTINWLGATSPKETEDKIWFDRKPRQSHAYAVSRNPKTTAEELIAYLENDIDKHLPQSTK